MSALIEETPNKKQRVEELSALEQLKQFTTIVADTGEFSTIQQFSPQDATTNPSLILKAALNPNYETLIDQAVATAKASNTENKLSEQELLQASMEQVLVNFAKEITKIVPGYVSIEVDARLSFNTTATVDKARQIIAKCKAQGIDTKRILIKIAATYEGIQAGKILQQEGIQCNLTLVFSLVQAVACAESKITLISPFVGRILDWHKAKTGKNYAGNEDPGVLSVKTIYHYFKKFNYNTIVMGASFRNLGEIIELAGCDRLTISPALLEELKQNKEVLLRKLDPKDSEQLYQGNRLEIDEASFRYQLNDDAMATEKLSEGIRSFAADIIKLEGIMKKKLA